MAEGNIIRETENKLIHEGEVVMKWSKKRIGIGALVLFFLIAGGIYGAKLLAGDLKQVLGTKTNNNKPQIQIPNAQTVQKAIDTAKQDLSNVNPQNVVESQPQIQKVINDLQSIVSSSTSAKSLICDTLCK